MSYTYYSGTNKLKNVVDASNDPTTKLGDFRASQAYLTSLGGSKTNTATDYNYDDNGNLQYDKNKDIASIAYNHLNLPQAITVTGKGTISYVYDAAGSKLQKITDETTASVVHNETIYSPERIVTTTTYIGGNVYESKAYPNNSTLQTALGYTDKLQFLGNEEGRTRYIAAEGTNPARLEYDYMIKDHLGNVRVLITEEQQSNAYPAATMETTETATEEQLYAGLPETRADLPAGYPTDAYTNTNDKVAKVGGTSNPEIGPSIVLKVMAGDKFNLRVSSWYKTGGTTPTIPLTPLTNVLASALASSVGGLSNVHGNITAGDLSGSGILTPSAADFLTEQQSMVFGRPKAYVNWLLLDERFNYVAGSSGAQQVGTNEEFKLHELTNLPISKSGYLYVFVNNETTNVPVYFDNLQVTHIRGPLLEETHYYPFGLTMAGISRKAAGFQSVQRHKFNGIEQNLDFDLNMYDAYYRNLDPQTGRFWQIDPKPSHWESGYAAMGNNAILNSDFLGDTISPRRTKGVNFFIIPDKKLRKEDIDLHKPPKGILKGIRGFFRSAYAADNIKVRAKSLLSFGKLKVITAGTAKEAVDKIIDKLGENGYVDNLTIDYHADNFGPDSPPGTPTTLSSSTDELNRLANGYAGGKTTVYLGNCWAGGNAGFNQADYTEMISNALDGAVVYGNQAAASSISFVLFSNFIGVVPEPYGKSPANKSMVGRHTVASRDTATGTTVKRTTTQKVRIENDGKINEQ